MARAPWEVTTLVSCLPVLVLGMGAALAHMIHADQVDARDLAFCMARQETAVMATSAGPDEVVAAGPVCTDQDLGADQEEFPSRDRLAEVKPVASGLAASGRRVSRRALRAAGVRGSNAELGSMARIFAVDNGAAPPA
jgi:hypothetical protein